MKRFWKYLTLAALLLALLAGCAAETAETAEPQDSEATQTEPPAEQDGTEDAEDPAEPVPDVAEVEEMTVTLYLPNDTADAFLETEETVGAEPQEIVDALIAHGALPEGTEVLSFSLEDGGADDASQEAGGSVHMVLDLSSEFQTALASMGTSGETMMLGSLVNTMLAAYNADTVTVTIEGAALETGHNVYDAPMGPVEP